MIKKLAKTTVMILIMLFMLVITCYSALATSVDAYQDFENASTSGWTEEGAGSSISITQAPLINRTLSARFTDTGGALDMAYYPFACTDDSQCTIEFDLNVTDSVTELHNIYVQPTGGDHTNGFQFYYNAGDFGHYDGSWNVLMSKVDNYVYHVRITVDTTGADSTIDITIWNSTTDGASNTWTSQGTRGTMDTVGAFGLMYNGADADSYIAIDNLVFCDGASTCTYDVTYPHNLSTDVIIHYPLDDGSVWDDYMNNTDATNDGVDDTASGLWGHGASFVGANTDYANITGEWMDEQVNWTFIGWYKFNDNSAQNWYLFECNGNSGLRSYSGDAGNNQKIYFAGGGQAGSYSSTSVGDNSWHMVAFTYNQSDDKITRWIDGTTEIDQTATVSNMNYTNMFRWGYGGGADWYTGTMDEMYFYHRMLTGTELDFMYNNGYGLPTSIVFESQGAPAPPVSDNFTVTMSDPTTFTVTMVSPTQTLVNSTTTGTVTSGILENSTELWNITINASNYFDSVFLNYNVSTDISSALVSHPIINVFNKWNLSQLTTGFNITIDGTTYDPDGAGDVYVPFNESKNVTALGTDYESTTEEIALLGAQTFNITNFYQSFTILNSTEINTLALITNWTLHTEQGLYSTTNGTIGIYPNLGTYSWNWSNLGNYFNYTGLSLTIDEANETLTASGFWARNITFINALGLNAIYPMCSQSGYAYQTTYLMPKLSTTVNCTLSGYQDTNLTLKSMPDSGQYNMTPAMLWLVFTEQTSGIVETEDCNASPNNCDSFNATSVYVEQFNISLGRVVVKFNPDGADWQQIFEYTNDQDTHIKEYIQIITPDLVQQLKITGGGTPLENARVVVQQTGTHPETNETDWLTVFADFTSIDGFATVYINDQNTYKFCAQMEGFTTKCVIENIPASNSETILIDLEPAEAETGYNFIASSCPLVYYTNHSCTIEVNTYTSYNTICFNYTSATLNQSTCDSDSVSKSWNYNLNDTTGNVSISIYLDGTLSRTIYHNTITYTPTNEVDFEGRPDISGTTLLEHIRGNTTYLIVIYIIFTIIGVLMGFMAEKYFNGYGPYGAGLWFLILAMGKLYLFWVPVIIIGVYAIVEKLIPLFTNK